MHCYRQEQNLSHLGQSHMVYILIADQLTDGSYAGAVSKCWLLPNYSAVATDFYHTAILPNLLRLIIISSENSSLSHEKKVFFFPTVSFIPSFLPSFVWRRWRSPSSACKLYNLDTWRSNYMTATYRHLTTVTVTGVSRTEMRLAGNNDKFTHATV
jgi:hypothetical protein